MSPQLSGSSHLQARSHTVLSVWNDMWQGMWMVRGSPAPGRGRMADDLVGVSDLQELSGWDRRCPWTAGCWWNAQSWPLYSRNSQGGCAIHSELDCPPPGSQAERNSLIFNKDHLVTIMNLRFFAWVLTLATLLIPFTSCTAFLPAGCNISGVVFPPTHTHTLRHVRWLHFN